MNKDWSEKNKQIQKLLGKEVTYKEGVNVLIDFRNELFEQITSIVNEYPKEIFYLMPFAGADGYHSKTLAYSIWHIFRIEDIVAHTLIRRDEQVLFSKGYQEKIKSSIISTGNELQGEAIVEFSKELDVNNLYQYAKGVMLSTNEILLQLDYAEMKKKFGEEDKNRLLESGCVSADESAVWLVDYWCGKDVRGLIKMPFCRHWIMHIEAMLRIKTTIEKKNMLAKT